MSLRLSEPSVSGLLSINVSRIAYLSQAPSGCGCALYPGNRLVVFEVNVTNVGSQVFNDYGGQIGESLVVKGYYTGDDDPDWVFNQDGYSGYSPNSDVWGGVASIAGIPASTDDTPYLLPGQSGEIGVAFEIPADYPVAFLMIGLGWDPTSITSVPSPSGTGEWFPSAG